MHPRLITLKQKFIYNARHIPLLLNIKGHIHLNLHHGYELPGRFNKKVSQQRCGPFRTVKRTKRLISELELPIAWEIHSIDSVAQFFW